MRSIVLDNIIFSLQLSGGISAVWENLIRHLIVDRRFDSQYVECNKSCHNIFRKEIDIPSSLILHRGSKLTFINRYRDFKMNTEEDYVFHSSYYRLSKDPGAKNVTTVHDFTYEYYCQNYLAREIHKCQKYKSIIGADRIVCVSANTKRDLLRFVPEVKRGNIDIIYNGVSDEYKVLSNNEGVYHDYLLYVGARGGYKNFRFLVESIKDTKFKLLVCGKPLTESEEVYLNNSLGSDRYLVMTNVSNERLNEIYNSVYCLVYPSSYEGFGIPVIEAQKAGCPVIALNASSIPEVIGTSPLLLKALDRRELIDKLTLIQNNNIRDEVIISGIENSSRFSWDKMYAQYAALYMDL